MNNERGSGSGSDIISSRKLPVGLVSVRNINRNIDLIIEATTGTLLVGIVGINAAEILFRLFFNGSLTWVFEVNQLLANWLYFLGICLVYYRGGDITVDFFFARLSAAHQRLALILIHALVVGVLVVLAWYTLVLVEFQSDSVTMGLGIPNHWFTLPVFIGAVVMSLFVATDLVETWVAPAERPAKHP